MFDYTVFDYLLDSVFVIDADGKVVYCNEMAANLLQTSARRVIGKAMMSDYITFAEPGLLPFTAESHGRTVPSSQIETAYDLVKVSKTGKTQLTVRPAMDGNWVFFMHDVSLEETLAAKYKDQLRQTEEYARNLEKLVEARTAELRAVNQTLNAILDSLGQGFFTFNTNGDCGSVYTKVCEDVLETTPESKKAWEVLGIGGREQGQFKKWMDSIFNEYLPFEDLKNLGPGLYPHSENRRVVLDYFPIRRDKTAISDVVVVATDKTAEFEAQQALEAERQYAAMVVKYLKNKEQFLQFLSSVRETLKSLHTLGATPQAMNEVLRILHTLEGEAGAFSLRELRHAARESQHILEPYKHAESIPSSVQATYAKSLVNLKTDFEKFLRENENIFRVHEGESGRTVEVQLAAVNRFADLLKSGAPTLIHQFNDFFFKVPIESRLRYFDGLIQNVAEKLGKKIKPLAIECTSEIRIFPEHYAGFFSSLVHAFRNAVDHGLEEPTEREWGGKDPAGQIRVKVSAESDGIKFLITDDGRGIDPVMIREKLKEKFPDKDFSSQSDEEVIQNVCMPGFSSRDSIGEFSGRGVGLDALREEVLNSGGTLHLRSKVGEGTAIEIFIPEKGLELDLRRSA